MPQALEKETSSIEDPLLCNVELPLREVFYPLGFAFEIVTNRQAVLDAASESWRHCRPRAASGSSCIGTRTRNIASRRAPM